MLAIIFTFFATVQSHKILVLMPMNGKSHMNYMQVLIRELIIQNHEVSCITSIPLSGTKPNNYTEILIDPPFNMDRMGKHGQMF